MEDALALNRALWTAINAEFTDVDARRAWAADEVTWGLFAIPDKRVGRTRRRGRVRCRRAGLRDGVPVRLAGPDGRPPGRRRPHTGPARDRSRCQEHFGLTFPLVEASADDVPLPDDSFDLVVSEYGASVWCDPERWIAEAARLLRPGGRLVFLTNSVLVSLCVPEQSGYAGENLLRPQPDVRRVRWPEGGVEFHPSHGDWVRVLRTNGFVVEALHELYAPDDAETHRYYEIVTAEWARQWPVEDLWVASLR